MKRYQDQKVESLIFQRPSSSLVTLQFTPVFIWLEYLIVKKSYCIAPHQHEFFEIYYCHKGTYTCCINGHKLCVPAGQVLLIKPGDTHEDTVTSPCRFSVLQFFLYGNLGEVAAADIFRNDLLPKALVASDPEGSALKLLRAVRREDSKNDLAAPYIMDGLILQYLWLLVRRFPHTVFSKEFLLIALPKKFISDIYQFFNENRYRSLTVQQIAYALHMSESALTKECRKELGVPPLKAFLRYKMDKAMALLRHSNLSVKQVGRIFGYENQNQFSSLFKKYQHVSPREVIKAKEFPGLKML